MDSFGLLRWERFSQNPAVGTIVVALAKPRPTIADLSRADTAVARKPDDLPSRALRAELRLRVVPGESIAAPTMTPLFKMKKPDRFEASYRYYHWRRTRFPEQYGLTTDRGKATEPYIAYRQNDLLTLEISRSLGDMTLPERILLADWMERYGSEDGRKVLQEIAVEKPALWEIEVLRVALLRCGGYTLTGTYPGVSPSKLKQFPQALELAQRLRREHPECRVLDQMAGVAAKDLKRYDLARAYFNAYLARPDEGLQGDRRSRDVRELLAKLPK